MESTLNWVLKIEILWWMVPLLPWVVAEGFLYTCIWGVQWPFDSQHAHSQIDDDASHVRFVEVFNKNVFQREVKIRNTERFENLLSSEYVQHHSGHNGFRQTIIRKV